MKFTIIDSDVLEAMLSEIDELSGIVTSLHQNYSDKKLEKWLDSQDVCQILNISKRTLQTYRNNGKMPSTRIEHVIYYKSEDLENLLNNLRK